jgi:hypothetical protein
MTRHSKVSPRWAVASLAALVLLGCTESITIADINRDPGRFRDKDVSITGQVVTSFGAVGEGAYQVDDGTGRIWVLTERGGVPGQGARVRVTGRVTTGVTFAGRSFGVVLRESDRQTKSSR